MLVYIYVYIWSFCISQISQVVLEIIHQLLNITVIQLLMM